MQCPTKCSWPLETDILLLAMVAPASHAGQKPSSSSSSASSLSSLSKAVRQSGKGSMLLPHPTEDALLRRGGVRKEDHGFPLIEGPSFFLTPFRH